MFQVSRGALAEYWKSSAGHSLSLLSYDKVRSGLLWCGRACFELAPWCEVCSLNMKCTFAYTHGSKRKHHYTPRYQDALYIEVGPTGESTRDALCNLNTIHC